MRVTAIEKQRRPGRVNLFVDGRFALGLDAEVLADSGLSVGDDLDGEGLRALRETATRSEAMAAAMRLLSHRPRSVGELRQRLARRGTPNTVVDATIDRLKDLGLADDADFARSWVESRDRTSPRGRRLLRLELQAKGVDAEVSRQVLESIDEADAAIRAASRRAATLAGLPHTEFRRRLGDFLRRRGFGHDTVGEVVARLWDDAQGRTQSPDQG